MNDDAYLSLLCMSRCLNIYPHYLHLFNNIYLTIPFSQHLIHLLFQHSVLFSHFRKTFSICFLLHKLYVNSQVIFLFLQGDTSLMMSCVVGNPYAVCKLIDEEVTKKNNNGLDAFLLSSICSKKEEGLICMCLLFCSGLINVNQGDFLSSVFLVLLLLLQRIQK